MLVVDGVRDHFRLLGTALRMFTAKAWAVALVVGLLALLGMGALAAIFENPFFVRMTPVREQDYLFWVLSSVLVGLIVGSYVTGQGIKQEEKAVSGGLLSALAVGCPICNKVVVALIGTSGALAFFAPLQLYLGLAAAGLLVWALLLRAKALAASCPVTPGAGNLIGPRPSA